MRIRLVLPLALAGAILWCVVLSVPVAVAADVPAPSLPIARITSPISVDGNLSDEGWRSATPITDWFETNPGDNTPPGVKNTGYLAYDARFVYVGLRFEDKQPSRIRAPLGDRDNLSSSTDYGGVILDTRNDGRTAILFLANARGLQYDAVSDDGGGGEDSSPDFYWDAAGAVREAGWDLEIRIPLTSLRYPKADPQTWGIMLYRNYPREFRYQFFTNRLPKGSSCFVCHSSPLAGLAKLPGAGHLVAAPHVTASQAALPANEPGSRLRNGSMKSDAGLDLQWTPTAGTAIDATVNPDFSQVESDVLKISANERFALFYPEKRSFFLEGINLFSTPIQAVYTRTITSPRVGVRGTGKWGALAFTGLVADDRGGGQVVLPGPNGSSFADQDFRSLVAVGRARRDFGQSFASLLVSDREQKDGSSNRVVGPDFQWRPNKSDVVAGQLLWSFTRTPNRRDLSEKWDGRELRDHAADVSWYRATPHFDVATEYKEIGEDFRADNGYVPQAGYRQGYFETGYTWRPRKGIIRRLRTFFISDYSADLEGRELGQTISTGFGFDARWSSFVRIRYAWERVRVGEDARTLPRGRLFFTWNASPSRLFPGIGLDGYWGRRDVDFSGGRRGSGARVSVGLPFRLTDHLELRLDEEVRRLDVEVPDRGRPRLFTARSDRLRATYAFTSRAFVRLVGQHVSTRRDPALYAREVERHDASFTGSLLLAYKLNWQTVLYAGYGDNRVLGDQDALVPEERQLFVKLSYALQR